MKEVHFKSVFIQNFLSIGENTIEINFHQGITIITGENKDKGGKNGIGKSTIADAIFWCLFGDTIRELKKENIQHNLNKDECCVILKFDIKNSNEVKKYQIKRILNPAKIEILCDDKDVTLSTLPKNDDFIKNLINANQEVFNNAVIMSTNSTVPFMAQKKTEKRKFIEGILQLNIFGEMLLKTRAEYNDLKKENDILSNNFLNQQKNLDIFEKQKEKGEELKNNKILEFKNKIKETLDLINQLKNEIPQSKNELLKQKNDFDLKIIALKKANNKEVEKINNFNSEIFKLENEIKNKNTEIKKFKEKGNFCPVCNREYCDKDIDTVKNQILQLEIETGELSDKIKDINLEKQKILDFSQKIEDGIEKINEKNNETKNLLSKIEINDQKITLYNQNIKEHQKYIDDLNNEKQDYDKNIEETEKKIKELEKELKEVKKTMQILDSVKFILSEDGVKTYIVKKIITFLNERLNFYLQKLETPCKCLFDETFEETIYNENGKEVSYFNFSGGERKRIDTAILFTFQDVLRFHSGTSFSLNIYDELFDCALDTKGTDRVLDILKDKTNKYNESIYIVSHKNSEILNIENVIFLEKNNGVTTIKS